MPPTLFLGRGVTPPETVPKTVGSLYRFQDGALFESLDISWPIAETMWTCARRQPPRLKADFVYVSESNLCHKLLLDEAMAKVMWSCAQRQPPWLKVDFVYVSE